MSSNGNMNASRLRARLHHPIIDADGHWLEYGPTVRFWGEANPNFFTGTAVEKEAAALLAGGVNSKENDLLPLGFHSAIRD